MLQLDLTPFPEFTTKRLTLRRLLDNDAPALYVIRTDDEVMKYMDVPKAKSQEEMLKRIKTFDIELLEKKSINWGIRIDDSSDIIGTICIWNIDLKNHRGELGYMLMPQYHRQGLIHEAIDKVLEYGFYKLNLHTIEGRVSPSNVASIKVLERNGFKKEAYFHENYYYEGKFLDTVVYSLINPKKKTENAGV